MPLKRKTNDLRADCQAGFTIFGLLKTGLCFPFRSVTALSSRPRFLLQISSLLGRWVEHSFCYLWCQRSLFTLLTKSTTRTPWGTKNVASPRHHPYRKPGPRQNSVSAIALCLSVSVARVRRHAENQGGEERVLFGLYSHVVGQVLKQGQNLEAGADTKATKGCCLRFAWPDFL